METPKLPGIEPDKPIEPTRPQADIDEIAERIGGNAGQVEYEDRTSEAARDQGWGPVEQPRLSLVIDNSSAARSTEEEKAASKGRHPSGATPSRPLVELPNRGNNNSPAIPTKSEVQAGMTDEEIDRQAEVNKRGAAAAKAAIEFAQRNRQS